MASIDVGRVIHRDRGDMGMDALPTKKDPVADSILLEAQRLVHGPREKEYGHPFMDFSRTANLLNVLFPEASFKPEDVPLILIAVKLAREMHIPKRDNLVDIAGYAETRSRILEGR